MKKIEIEIKLKVDNPVELLKKLDGKKPKIFYVKDEVFGSRVKPKIRKRTMSGNINKIEIQRTTPIISENVNKKLEENLKRIPEGYKCENSYDKIRFKYKRDSCNVMVDFYSIGCFIEIEGTEKDIQKVAKSLKLDITKNISDNIE